MCLLARRTLRTERVFRDYDNPLNYLDDHGMVSKYRQTRQMIYNPCTMLDYALHRPTMSSRVLPLLRQWKLTEISADIKFHDKTQDKLSGICQIV